MKTVQEIMQMTGLSRRTLYYYDEIGLLPPTVRNEKGYRLYDDKAVERLFAIMAWRKLDVELDVIRQILDDDGVDREAVIVRQMKKSEQKREHYDKVVQRLQELLRKGDSDEKER